MEQNRTGKWGDLSSTVIAPTKNKKTGKWGDLAPKSTNTGGFLGGIGYFAGKAGTGLASIGEGITDLVIGGTLDLIGQDEAAKHVFEDSWVGDWNQALDEWYNPSGAIKVVGDIGSGIGQSVGFVGTTALGSLVGAPQLGLAVIGTSGAGNAIGDAVRKTDKLGAKEYIYGTASGITEVVLEKVVGTTLAQGAKLAGKTGAKLATKQVGSKLGKAVLSNSARKGFIRTTVTEAAEEGLEEFLSTAANTVLLNVTGVDKKASFSLYEAGYSALIGFVSGGLMSGVTQGTRNAMNYSRGMRITNAGNTDTMVRKADYIADKMQLQSDHKKLAPIFAQLSNSREAYQKLKNKDGARAALYLGEMQEAVTVIETRAKAYQYADQFAENIKEDPSKAEEYAQKVNILLGTKYTAQDVIDNTNVNGIMGVRDMLGVIRFAGEYMNESLRKAEMEAAVEAERGVYADEEVQSVNTEAMQSAEQAQSAEQVQMSESAQTGERAMPAANASETVDFKAEADKLDVDQTAQKQEKIKNMKNDRDRTNNLIGHLLELGIDEQEYFVTDGQFSEINKITNLVSQEITASQFRSPRDGNAYYDRRCRVHPSAAARAIAEYKNEIKTKGADAMLVTVMDRAFALDGRAKPSDTYNKKYHPDRVVKKSYPAKKQTSEKKKKPSKAKGRHSLGKESSAKITEGMTEDEKATVWLTDDDLNEYMKVGKRKHTRDKKQRLLDQGKKPILTSSEEAKAFLSKVIHGHASGETRAFGKVNQRLASAVKEIRDDLDIYGNYIELNADGLREAYKRHSDPKESGDIPLTEKDFQEIPQYIIDFDGITSIDTFKDRTQIYLYKETQEGYIRILSITSSERGALQVTKIIGVSKEKFESKYVKTKERVDGRQRGQTDKSEASNSSTRTPHTSMTLSDTIISQKEEKSNTFEKKSARSSLPTEETERNEKTAEQTEEAEESEPQAEDPHAASLALAREYVEGFDGYAPETRENVLEWLESAEGKENVTEVTKRAISAIIVAQGKVRVVFDERIQGDGFYFHSGYGASIVLINPSREANVIETTLVHELTHTLEGKPAYEPLAKLADKVIKTEQKKSVALRYYTYRLRQMELIDTNSPTPDDIRRALAFLGKKDRTKLDALNEEIRDEVRAHLISETLTSEKHIKLYAELSPGLVAKLWGRARRMALALYAVSGKGAAYRTARRMQKLYEKAVLNKGKSKGWMKRVGGGDDEDEKKKNTIHARNSVSTENPSFEIEIDTELARRIEKTEKSKYSAIKDYLIEKFHGQTFSLSDGKQAIMDNRDAQELAHKADELKTAELSNLKKLVESAVLVSETDRVTHKKFDAFSYYAITIKFNDQSYDILINVGRAKNDGSHHIYDITKNNIKKEESPTGHLPVWSRPVGHAITNDSSINSIPDSEENVNTSSEKIKKKQILLIAKNLLQKCILCVIIACTDSFEKSVNDTGFFPERTFVHDGIRCFYGPGYHFAHQRTLLQTFKMPEKNCGSGSQFLR